MPAYTLSTRSTLLTLLVHLHSTPNNIGTLKKLNMVRCKNGPSIHSASMRCARARVQGALAYVFMAGLPHTKPQHFWMCQRCRAMR